MTIQMRVRNLRLFVLALVCLTHPALSIGQDSKSQPADEILQDSKPADFNRDIYYKHKLEFSLETGGLPTNIPFVFDFLVSNHYERTPVSYTVVPTFVTLRWQLRDIGGPRITRGNTELTFSPSFTVIPRGPETRYAAFNMGLRHNFVQPNWRIVPYLEARGGLGFIDAKGPKGVAWAQGQDFTFTLMLGSGVRYNFNSRYSISAGVSYMHVSNALLSEPKYEDFGINVVGPVIAVNARLGKPRPQSAK